MTKHPSIIPALSYKNAPAAIEWLCRTLGFEKKVVYGDGEIVANAQLCFGNGMIMLSSQRKNDFGKLIKTPQDLNGFNAVTPYLIVEAIDEHYQKAVAEGAKIVMELQTQDGRRGYSCQDPEGYIWNFGDYNPWV